MLSVAKSKKKQHPSAGGKTIGLNKRARFDYHLEERFEAGLVLEGWEVKSLRAGRLSFSDSYILLQNREAYLFGARMDPLPTTSSHSKPDPTRTRKLLLHRYELARLIGAVERKGFTLIPTAMYWKAGRAKLEIALAKGKQSHDKRATEKERDWNRDKQRMLRRS